MNHATLSAEDLYTEMKRSNEVAGIGNCASRKDVGPVARS